MKFLYLIRGVPGSGKSSLARIIWNDYAICEADKFFVDEEGNYNFDPSKIRQAHDWCKLQVENRMGDNAVNPQYYPEIVVSNTFTQEWELADYYKLAEQYGYKVFSLIVENRHGGKDVHGVPEEKLVQMETNLRNNIKLR
jgi:ABC-type molybdenum transport system ATPase subunit/photorepair protein PhrA